MTISQIGLTRDEKHVYRWNGGDPLPSVTTVLQVVDKSGPLIGWAKRITAEAAVDHREQIDGWVDIGGRDGAVSFLTKAATAQRDRAANAGSEVHQFAEAIVKGQQVEVPPELAPFVTSFLDFRAKFQPRYLAAEEMVCSLKHNYAGTLDAIVEISGEVWLIDYKTSKGVYPETALQLAAYSRAEFIGKPGLPTKFKIPEIAQYGVLHLRPEGFELVPYSVTPETFRAFLAARLLHSWREDEGRKVIGQAIGPALLKFQAPAKEIA